MDHSSRDLLTVSLMNIGDKELNDVVCAAYKMGCEQTREVYQKRIETLVAVLRTYACNCGLGRDWLCEDRETSSECGYRANKVLEELR